MDSEDYIPGTEAMRVAWFSNLASAAAAMQSALGLTAADITALNNGAAQYSGSVISMTSATAAYHAATQNKSAANKSVTAAARGIVRRIQANPAVTPAMKEKLQINTRDKTRSKTPPATPTQLLATPDASGVNRLRWNLNGNKKSTTYIVQALYPGASDFTFVDNATGSRYDHMGQTPGVTVIYRVIASRAKMKSNPSQTAAVYFHSPAVTLSKAA